MDQTLTIACPHCKQTISLDDALIHQIEAKAFKELEAKHRQDLELAKSQASDKLLQEVKFLREENERKKKELEVAQQQELDLRKQKNLLEENKRKWELEKQRELDSEKEKIWKKAQDETIEKHKLKEKEFELKIEGLKKSLDEAQRKASQGSQQTQGEALEINLEEMFRSAFPEDAVEPVGKGLEGADIRQTVKSPKGTICGTILWESKRTKLWSDGWVAKLKTDMLADKANIVALLSETLPEEAKSGIGIKNGVWVANPKLAIPLAMLLRKSLLDATYQKVVSEHRQTKAEMLYSYIMSHEFQNQVESLIEVYRDMQLQITKERTAFEKSWKQREQQVNRLLSGVAGIYGSMQGIAGPALRQIKNFELTDGD